MKPSKYNLESIWNDFRAGRDTRFHSRLTGVNNAGSGADYHYRDEMKWLHMMERARHYQRNDPVVGQAVKRLVANVLQEGFTLDPQTGDKSINADLKFRWNHWSEDPDLCHSEQEFTLSQIEQLVLSAVIVDGDVFVLPLRTGELQCIEAHRVRTPRNTQRDVVHGVLMDKFARRKEYWVTREDLDANALLTRVSDIRAFPARDRSTGQRLVNHLYMPQRFSQRRGITAIAPISDMVGMHDDIQFSQLVKSQMAALIAVFHERGPDWRPTSNQQKGPQSEEQLGGHTRTIEGVSAGLEIFGDIDEKLSAFSPNIPNPEFFQHALMVLQFIAINLDLPVGLLLLDPSNTNFSGWRGATDQARMRFRQIQKWFANSFHSRTYRWKLQQWIESDPALRAVAERADIDIFNHKWHPPTFPYIEPMKDVQADLLQLRNGLNSPRRIQANRGRDIEEVVAETIEDNTMSIAMAIKAAMKLNDINETAGVHWRDVLGLSTPEGISASMPAQVATTEEVIEEEPEEVNQPPLPPNGFRNYHGNGHQ